MTSSKIKKLSNSKIFGFLERIPSSEHEILFSTSVELESDNVCLCVYLSVCPKTLGHAGGFKIGQIWLKFGTLVPLVNIWGCFFHFSKILIFGAWVQVFSQNEAKTLGQPGGFKNGSIWLKFGTHVPWVNIWGRFHFSKILIFGAWGRVFHNYYNWPSKQLERY